MWCPYADLPLMLMCKISCCERLGQMTDVTGLWLRPGMRLPQPFDTILFDVDGVLIRTTESFHLADIAATEYIVGTVQGLDWGQHDGRRLLTVEDIDVFKRAGGFNSDWDMTYLLSSLFTARLREWSGSDMAQRSAEEWATIARQAVTSGQTGRGWVDATFPAGARPDYEQLVDIYTECYWGEDELRKRFGRSAAYLKGFKGFVHNEEIIYPRDLFSHLKAAGIQHFGMITGRVGPEVDVAKEHMEAYSGERWWEIVVSADQFFKPDPRALQFALEKLGTHGGLYIGDTADDFDLVRRYREVKTAGEPAILAAMVVTSAERELYRGRGADVMVDTVGELVGLFEAKSSIGNV
jgi:HAD superfamily phosphatase